MLNSRNSILVIMLGCVGIGVAGPKEQFLAQRNWKFHGEVKAAAKKINVVKKGEDVIGNVSDAGKSLRAPFLITKNKFSQLSTSRRLKS